LLFRGLEVSSGDSVAVVIRVILHGGLLHMLLLLHLPHPLAAPYVDKAGVQIDNATSWLWQWTDVQNNASCCQVLWSMYLALNPKPMYLHASELMMPA
jgi:hypothetical protein